MDTTIKPQISIIICTYNRAHTISGSIESVLNQNLKEWELLILDDASTDNTEDIVKKYLNDSRIRYIKNQQNLGIAKNRNLGIEQSKSDLIAMLDSDDVWIENDKLQKQKLFLDNNKDHAIVGTNVIIIDGKQKEISRSNFFLTDKDIRNEMLLNCQIAQSSVLYKKENIVEFGMYDDSYEIADDYDLWLKVGTKYKIANLTDYTTKYLEHSKGISKKKKLKHAIEHKNIVHKFKKYYPNYTAAILKSYARILISIF